MKKNPALSAVLTIAGLDPSSGAGLTADLKVFAAHGLYGLSCPTALTVQSTQGVRRSVAVSPDHIRETLVCLAEDIPIAGIKIGMLGSGEAVSAVAAWLRESFVRGPVVLDPVLRSSSGHPLLPADAVPLLLQELLPLVLVVTPNLPEAALLTGFEQPEAAAAALLRHTPAVVITGGHSSGPDTIADFLATRDEHLSISGPRVHTSATHGTGCAFSSALLSQLVLGRTLPAAVHAAKQYVAAALEKAYPLGRGRGPMHHLYAYDSERFLDALDAPDAEPSK